MTPLGLRKRVGPRAPMLSEPQQGKRLRPKRTLALSPFGDVRARPSLSWTCAAALRTGSDGRNAAGSRPRCRRTAKSCTGKRVPKAGGDVLHVLSDRVRRAIRRFGDQSHGLAFDQRARTSRSEGAARTPRLTLGGHPGSSPRNAHCGGPKPPMIDLAQNLSTTAVRCSDH
jgi:hypothetical protein